MLNLGTGELLVVFLVALIVLGPNKLPDAARQMGKMAAELRRLSGGFQEEMRNAMREPTPTLPPLPTPPAPDTQTAPATLDVAEPATASATTEVPAESKPKPARKRRAPLKADTVSAEQQLTD